MNLKLLGGVLVCGALVACSGGGGPKDEEVVMGVRALLATRGFNPDGVKKLDCEKMKESQVKDSGVFYACSFELDFNGKKEKGAASFQKLGEDFMIKEIEGMGLKNN